MSRNKRIRNFRFWAKFGLFLSGFISAAALIPAFKGDMWTGIIMILLGNLAASFSAVAYGKVVRAEFGE